MFLVKIFSQCVKSDILSVRAPSIYVNPPKDHLLSVYGFRDSNCKFRSYLTLLCRLLSSAQYVVHTCIIRHLHLPHTPMMERRWCVSQRAENTDFVHNIFSKMGLYEQIKNILGNSSNLKIVIILHTKVHCCYFRASKGII